jgi:hypothetical protein
MDAAYMEVEKAEGLNRAARRRQAIESVLADAPVRSVVEAAPTVKYDRRQPLLVSLDGGVEASYDYAFPVIRK